MKKAIVLNWLVDHDSRSVIPMVSTINAPMKEEDNLKFFYDSIGCNMIDVVRMDGFDIFVDDEGLLTGDNLVCEYSQGEFKVPLAGSLVFTNGIDSIGRTLWFESNNPDDMVTMETVFNFINTAKILGMSQAEEVAGTHAQNVVDDLMEQIERSMK